MSSKLIGRLVWTALLTTPGIFTTVAIAADAGESPSLEEIVVTAQRREESMQGMSLSIIALKGDALLAEGKNRLEDALSSVAGVSLQQSSNPGGTPFIRGIGPALGTDPATAVSLDGVYQSEGLFGSQFDVARVEVLRGPQGTLYGRNSTAGSVNIITHDPSDVLEGSGSLQAGNYSAVRFEGMLNVPLSDKLALRAAMLSSDHKGYYSNGTGDEDTQAVRVKLKYVPTDAITLLLATDYTRLGGKGLGSVDAPISSHDGDPWYSTAIPGRQQSTRKSVYGQLDWDLGIGVLTYLPSWYEVQVYQDVNLLGDLGLLVTNKRNRQQTHELRLASPSGQPLKWLMGAYYLNNKGLERPLASYLAPGFHSDSSNFVDTPTETESKAVFSQLTLPLTDSFRLVVGGRYTWDVKSASRTFYASNAVNAPISNITPRVSLETNKFTYKVGAEFDVTSANLLYATYSTAFKAGGINDATGDFSDPSTYATYKPETLKAIEMGSKNRFLDDRVQLNVSAFHYDYADFQVFTPVFSVVPPIVAVLNAASAKLWGGEIESSFAITTRDRLDVSAAYNHTRFDEFIYFSDAYPPPTGLDRSGERLPLAPQWTGALKYTHDFVFRGGSALSLGGQMRFYTDSDVTIEPNVDSRQPGYSLIDVHALYKPADAHWSLNAYVNNATDRVVRQFSAQIAGVAQELGIAPPRTYGVGITANF